jgi:hypothetical protein
MDQQYATPHGNVVIDSVDLQNGEFVQTQITIPLQEGAVGLGRPVTVAAAQKMINAYADQLTNDDDTIAIEFGKESLQYLLSQRGCESIKFYFCINHLQDRSLIATLLDATGNPIFLSGQMSTQTSGQSTGGSATMSTTVIGTEVGGKHIVAEWRQSQTSGGTSSPK